jgi:hypothetical protein
VFQIILSLPSNDTLYPRSLGSLVTLQELLGLCPITLNLVQTLRGCLAKKLPKRSVMTGCYDFGFSKVGIRDETIDSIEDGARYRVRTCDPYRVKVMLYH